MPEAKGDIELNTGKEKEQSKNNEKTIEDKADDKSGQSQQTPEDSKGTTKKSVKDMQDCWEKDMKWDLDCGEKSGQQEEKCCIKACIDRFLCHRKRSKNFDLRSEEYYHIAWHQLCNEADTDKAEDILFMDRLILRARYVHDRKEFEKNRYFKGEKWLINLTLFNALFNAIRFYHANELINKTWPQSGEMINMWINDIVSILCVVISAFTAWFTSRLLLGAHKETWLRHMSFYSKITLEADTLFAGAGDYEGLGAKEKIALFKAKTVIYTGDDYQNFFANMTGNKNAADENSSVSTNASSAKPDSSPKPEQKQST